MNIISLGAGVQSSTMALMATHGEITPMPDGAIFADTQWEPKAVYDWLNWLEKQLPFPVYRVSKGNLRDNITKTAHDRFVSMPFYLDTGNGEYGMVRRQCTREFKVEPIEKKTRKLLGYEPRKRIPERTAIMWIGISRDEATRMKPARNKWQINRWPLIEKYMTKADCLLWMKRNDYPEPPKSSCIGCPYHSDAYWRKMRDSDPESWNDAIEFDGLIRNCASHQSKAMKSKQYLHSSLKPLDQVDLSTDEDRGQLNMFNNECEGLCGV